MGKRQSDTEPVSTLESALEGSLKKIEVGSNQVFDKVVGIVQRRQSEGEWMF